MSSKLDELCAQLEKLGLELQVGPALLKVFGETVREAKRIQTARNWILKCNMEGCKVKGEHMHMPTPLKEQVEYVKGEIEKGALKDLPIEKLPTKKFPTEKSFAEDMEEYVSSAPEEPSSEKPEPWHRRDFGLVEVVKAANDSFEGVVNRLADLESSVDMLARNMLKIANDDRELVHRLEEQIHELENDNAAANAHSRLDDLEMAVSELKDDV